MKAPMQGYWWKYRKGKPLDPNEASDDDFLHLLDFSDDDRRTESGGVSVTEIWTQKDKKLNADSVEWGAAQAVAPLITATTINGLKTCQFNGAVGNRRTVLADAFHDDYQFSYTDYTIFAVIQTDMLTTDSSILVSDYGSHANKLMYIQIGDGATLKFTAFMRDVGGDDMSAVSTVNISNATPTLLVARMTGSGKLVECWVGGLGYDSGTDASYDPTTTFEGTVNASAIPTMGTLADAGHTSPFDGYVGEIFICKTALTNANINSYARFLANKWDVSWKNI